MKRAFRPARPYYESKQRDALIILGFVAKSAAAIGIAWLLAFAFVEAIVDHPQQYELPQANRAAIITSLNK